MSKFTNLAELIKAVYLESKGIKDERLIEHKDLVNETSNADGGYLVTQPLIGPILENLQQKSTLYSRALRLTTSSYGAKVPMVNETYRNTESSGTLEAYWIGEYQKKIKDKPQFSQLDMKLHKLVVLMPVTDELMQDSVLLQSWVDEFVAKKLAWKIDEAILIGDGSTQMYGIMSADTNGVIGVATPDPLDENCLENYVKALAPAASRNAEWYMSKENYNDVLDLTFTNDGNFGYEDGRLMLFGMPVNVLEQMRHPHELMLGDISQYCVIQKGGIEKAVNISLRYNYDESVIRWVIRINGKSFGNTYTLEDGTEVGTFVIPENMVTGSSSSESMSYSSSSSTEEDKSQSTSSETSESGSTQSMSSRSSQSGSSSSSTEVATTSSSSSTNPSESSGSSLSESSGSSMSNSSSSSMSKSSSSSSNSSSSSSESSSSSSSSEYENLSSSSSSSKSSGSTDSESSASSLG